MGGDQTRLSRRNLLGGAAVATVGLPGICELVPQAGLHPVVNGDGAEHVTDHARMAAAQMPSGGIAMHDAFGGRTVDHAANGFDPTALVRDFDYGTSRRLASGRVLREWTLVASDRELEIAPGVSYEAWTYNGRIPGPTLRAREGELLRVRFVNGSSHPHTIHFHGVHPAFMDGMPGIGEPRGGGLIESGERVHLRVRGRPIRPSPLPLPRDAAGRAHREGPLRRVHRRPEAGSRRGRRAGDGHERLRHQLRSRERDLRRQLDPVPLRRRADPRQARRARADLPAQHPRVRSAELVPHPRQLLRLLPNRHAPRVERVHRHDHPGAGPARDSELRFPYAGTFMFHAHKTEFAELGWLGFFEVV